MTFSPMMFSVPRLDDTSATNIHGQQSAEATSRQHDLAAIFRPTGATVQRRPPAAAKGRKVQ